MAQGLSKPKGLKEKDEAPVTVEAGELLTKDSEARELLFAILCELRELKELIQEQL